ncbi:MAG: ABC-type antimicrobial peptide transport system [Thermodesulfobacterium sp.]|uniref:ABC-type antimicrobial peptide transport system n=1 Tax=Candidatus Thermodesulfobacterium syntrophicum TaxID=3060442 RepID=A0AAE3TFP7_9BACT|nr:ABC-type antimicrobial peptide transport system [Candidatus Thermodesulfobacterium syntrophicum]
MFIKYKLLWGGVFHKKLRLFLSVIGIIIGVASLLLMNSFGESAKIKTLKEIETFGPEVMIVVAGSVRVHGGRAIQTEITTTLKPADAEALRKIKGIKYLSPVFNGEGIVRYLGNNLTTIINGVNEEYLLLRKFPILEGRNFLKDEILGYKKVAILGYKVKRELFGNENPLGKIILINKLPFRVIGVLSPIGIDASNADQDDQILIPWSVAISAVYNVDYIRSIYLSVENLEEMHLIEKQINGILLKRHKVNEKNKDFEIVKAEDILQAKTKTTELFSTLVKSISILCLLVGALGVTAIMTLSVNERKKEIGIRKALGAEDRNILFQFLAESVFITLFGGAIGILIGVAGSLIFLPLFNYPLVFPWIPIFTSTLLTIFSGIIAGIYPAYKATRIEPIILLKQGF